MRVVLVSPTYPPDVCGIGDYSHRLATELATGADVRVLSGGGTGHVGDRVRAITAFDRAAPGTFQRLAALCLSDRPDWTVWQYSPFAFGRRYGINPGIPWVMAKLRAAGLRQAVVVHEIDLPGNSPKRLALRAALGLQLGLICLSASAVFATVTRWADGLRRCFPHKVIRPLPVGATLTNRGLTRWYARQQLGITDDQTVLGFFGRLDFTREVEHVRRAVARVASVGRQPLLYYFGASADMARQMFADLPHRADGPLSAAEVSLRMSAVDIYLSAYSEGITARRTSLMVALQHGVPTVATFGRDTEAAFRAVDGRGMVLVPAGDPDRFASQVAALAETPIPIREAIGMGGLELYNRSFDWPVVASALTAGLQAAN